MEKALGALGGHGSLHLQVDYQKMDSPFVRCAEEDDYQKMLATLLADVNRRLEVPNVPAVILLVLWGSFVRLYLMSN